jgi:predicted amidohydrolase
MAGIFPVQTLRAKRRSNRFGYLAFFEPGSRVVTFAWQNVLVAPFICYDLRFPEAFRAAVEAGGDLYG